MLVVVDMGASDMVESTAKAHLDGLTMNPSTLVEFLRRVH